VAEFDADSEVLLKIELLHAEDEVLVAKFAIDEEVVIEATLISAEDDLKSQVNYEKTKI